MELLVVGVILGMALWAGAELLQRTLRTRKIRKAEAFYAAVDAEVARRGEWSFTKPTITTPIKY